MQTVLRRQERKSKIPSEFGEPPQLILLAGPTGSGKTSLLTELDSEFFEAVSFDSRQVYGDLAIGTTAPSKEEISKMPHSMVGFLNSNRSVEAKTFQILAAREVDRILSEGKIPILVAGTGFYLKAFLYGMYPAPNVPESIHSHVLGLKEEDVVAQLKELDRQAYDSISPNDYYRYRRALEINLTGTKWSEVKLDTEGGFLRSHSGLLIRGFFLDWDRKELYLRINERAKNILLPMAEEAKIISDRYGRDCPGLLSLGYDFALDFLAGRLNIETFYEGIAKTHRNYAKRQVTWFRKEPLLESVSWDFALRTLLGFQLLIKNNKK
jgi:tRNA dimethylallyltransferase